MQCYKGNGKEHRNYSSVGPSGGDYQMKHKVNKYGRSNVVVFSIFAKH